MVHHHALRNVDMDKVYFWMSQVLSAERVKLEPKASRLSVYFWMSQVFQSISITAQKSLSYLKDSLYVILLLFFSISSSSLVVDVNVDKTYRM